MVISLIVCMFTEHRQRRFEGILCDSELVAAKRAAVSCVELDGAGNGREDEKGERREKLHVDECLEGRTGKSARRWVEWNV